MYLIAKTVDKDGKEYIDIFPGKTGEIEKLETLAYVLLEEVDGEGVVHFYSAEVDELGRVEMPGNGSPEPIIGFRATGGIMETLVFSPFSGSFVTEKAYEYEYRIYRYTESY